MKSFTLPSTGVLNVSFEPASTTVATDENTLKLFPLNGFSSSDFSKTVNIVNGSTDSRQLIKNAVRFQRLEFGGQNLSGDNNTYAGNQIISEGNPSNPGTISNLIFENQTGGGRNFRLRDLNANPNAHVTLIDDGGNQVIKDELTVRNSIRVAPLSGNTLLNLAVTPTTAIHRIWSKDATIDIANPYSGTSDNKIKLGNEYQTSKNTITFTGNGQTNTINMGDVNKICTNVININSAAGGSNNLYLGNAASPGGLTLSGGQTVNAISNTIGPSTTTLPTSQAILNYFLPGTSDGSMTLAFKLGTLTQNQFYIRSQILGMRFYRPNTSGTGNIYFVTTDATNTYLQITLELDSALPIGTTLFTSMVEFANSTFAMTKAVLTAAKIVQVQIKGSGYLGGQTFLIPPFFA